MGNLLSGKMRQWLKWPTNKQIVFLLVCIVVTASLMSLQTGGPRSLYTFLSQHSLLESFINQNTGSVDVILLQIVKIFMVVVFIGMILVGWYDGLWLPALVNLIIHVVDLIVERAVDPTAHIFFEIELVLMFIWVLSIVFLRVIPRRISEQEARLAQEQPEAKIIKPGYKLSGTATMLWIVILGLVFLYYGYDLLTNLRVLDWANAYEALFTVQDNCIGGKLCEPAILALELLGPLLWCMSALSGLVDIFRKDAYFFYIGIGIFTLWQLAKMLIFFGTSYPLHENTIIWTLVLLLIGASLLLRAALNRPAPAVPGDA